MLLQVKYILGSVYSLWKKLYKIPFNKFPNQQYPNKGKKIQKGKNNYKKTDKFFVNQESFPIRSTPHNEKIRRRKKNQALLLQHKSAVEGKK